MDNTSRILKIGFVCIQNVSDVVISVIRNINDFVYHQNHLRPRSHGIRRCSAAAPRRVYRPMYLPDNQHQKKIFQYLIMHMSALDMLYFLQRIKTHFRFFMTYPKIRIGNIVINTHKKYGKLRFLNVICNTQSITDLYRISLQVFLYIKLIRPSLHIVFRIIKRQFFILLTFSLLSYGLLPSISFPAPQSHNHIHKPHPP